MYESFFNLKTKPFELVPNPEFLFPSKVHRRARIYLEYGISERAGFILLTGEVGSGKTTLIRDLIKKLRPCAVLSKIFNTNVNFDQLLSMINDDFKLDVAGKDKTTLLRDLNDFLIQKYALGARPILIIDEAQNLTAEMLENIRMLSNLETDDAKLLQIILVGQPELRTTLSRPELLQLRQRISINCHITPLPREEIEEYILHRLEVAGNRHAVAILPEALDTIYRYSRGVPRLINIICDFLLLSAYAEEVLVLDGDMTREVIGDLDFERHFWESKQPKKTGDSSSSTGLEHETEGTARGLEVSKGMTERICTLEKKSLEFREATLREMGEKFTALGNAFRFYAQETETTVSWLRGQFEMFHENREGAPIPEREPESLQQRGRQVLIAALRKKN